MELFLQNNPKENLKSGDKGEPDEEEP